MLKKLVFVVGLIGAASNSIALAEGFIEYGGCKEEDFVTIDTAEVLIDFQGSSYEPACINIKPGTKVTISAMKKHPLQAAQDFEKIINPFRSDAGEFLEDQTRELTVPGFYGYYCTRHGDPTTGQGMGGMIRVIAPQ